MRDRIFALLGIESGEESMVTMLLTQSVFLGIFFGAFDISAHSLFLSIFDEKMMAKAYVVSGLAGIVLTSLYTWLQTKLKFRNFSIINLIAVTSLTLLLWIALLVTESRWIVFLVFIMLGPLNILAALGFWGTAGRLFTLRQGKRLFGLIDSGVIVGIIISCYTIPVVLSLNFASKNIILISAAAVLAASLMQMIIGSRFAIVLGKSENRSEEKKERSSVFSLMKKDRYIAVMALFVALSMVTAFFVQYSFMAVTRQQYPAEEDMARFLGIFTGSMMIFTLLVKLLAFSYLIRNYGLKVSLTISPILISVMAAIAILIGLTMGYTPAAVSGFMIFFLILALSRLFSKSLKDSIESPSFKVIYQTLDEKVRFEVQSAMDGTVNEIAALSSGLLLAGLGMLSFIKLIHFSVVLFVIILAWIAVAFMLYNGYRKSIRKALEENPSASGKPLIPEGVKLKSRFSAELAFRKDYYKLVTGGQVPEEPNISRYYEKIVEHTADTRDINLIPLLRRLSGDPGIDTRLRQKTGEVLIHADEYEAYHRSGKSGFAKRTLLGERVPQTTELLRLLRDNNLESKRYAIYIIGKFRLTDMLSEVCECLTLAPLETDASAVLTSFGAESVEALQRTYMAESGNIFTGAAVMRILAKIPGTDSSSFIFSRLWSTSRYVRETAAECLMGMNYIASGEEKDKLHQLISDITGLMTWNLAARVSLQRHNDSFLTGVLDKDIARWKKFLFDLLSLAYDRSAIAKINENLEKDTVESGNFALEMIDIVIDESIKPKIIALLDKIPDEDKLKNLWHFFPGEIPAYDNLIEDIINRDYNYLGLWTRACALRNHPSINDDSIAESASALLFSPELLMQEEAAGLMARSGEKYYGYVAVRIPDPIRRKLDRIIKGEKEREEYLYEKVLFLAGYFGEIPEEELLVLAEKLTYSKDLSTDATCTNGCIVWSMNGKGKAIIINGNELKMVMDKAPGYYLPLGAIEEFIRHYPGRTTAILTYIDQNEE